MTKKSTASRKTKKPAGSLPSKMPRDAVPTAIQGQLLDAIAMNRITTSFTAATFKSCQRRGWIRLTFPVTKKVGKCTMNDLLWSLTADGRAAHWHTLSKKTNELNATLRRTESDLHIAQDRLSNAHSIAFENFMQHTGQIKEANAALIEGLAKILAPELMPYAQKLLAAAQEQSDPVPLMTIRLHDDYATQGPACKVLTAEIRRLHFNIKLGFLR